MNPKDFKKELMIQLMPSKYKSVLEKGVPASWLVLKKGAYAFACVPFSEVPADDYRNGYVKSILKKALKAFPVILEKGVFILYYGPGNNWENISSDFKVDKTGLRPVIVQAVHFFDPETGENVNSRTSWGPVKFGFCGPTIEKIEAFGNALKEKVC